MPQTGSPIPTAIKLHQKSQQLEVAFPGNTYLLPYEYLRVFSPSAEVRGHGNQQMTLIGGKKNVQVTNIEAVGRYAIKLTFDDGHDSGLYTWQTLLELGQEYSSNWQQYLNRLEEAGLTVAVILRLKLSILSTVINQRSPIL